MSGDFDEQNDYYEEQVLHSSPNRKVTAGALGGAVATTVVILLQWVVGTEVPVGLEGALATIFGFAAGYFARN